MARPKHHEPQSLVSVSTIRGRVIRGMVRELGSLRSFISCIPGNEHVVEKLRGKEGTGILERVTDSIMLELGDTSRVSKPNAAGVSRYIAGKGKGAMGTEPDFVAAVFENNPENR